MTPFLDGGPLLYAQTRPRQRSVFFIFLTLAVVLAACGGAIGGNNNWPGLSSDGQYAYVAAGPQVYALDITEENVHWTYPGEAGRASFFASPAIADGRMILGDFGASGGSFSSNITVSIYGLDSLDKANPGTLWEPVTNVAHDRIVAPPLLIENQLFIGTADGMVYALDAEDGSLQWQFAAEHAIWGQPAFADGVVYVTSLDKHLYALSAESGEELWQHEFAAAIPSAPVVSPTLIYVAGFDSQVHALSREDGAEQWVFDAKDWLWGAPALDGDTLFFADRAGNAYAVNSQTGELLWEVQAAEHIQATPLVNGEHLYIAATVGDSTDLDELTGEIIALSKENGDEEWRTATPGPIFTAPILVQEQLVVVFKTGARVNNQFQVNVYNPADGDVTWEFVPAE